MMFSLMGGPTGNGSISSSNRSILLRILTVAYFVLQDAEFRMPI
jgi:hypothetical protein